MNESLLSRRFFLLSACTPCGIGAFAETAASRPNRRASSGRLPEVRVLVAPVTARSVGIQVDGPYEIRDAGGRTVSQGQRLRRSSVTIAAGGLRIGKEALGHRTIEIVPRLEPSIWVGDNQYRGRLRLIGRSNSTVQGINLVALNDYLTGVIDSEMPPHFPPAARRAQAVAARSYVLYQMKTFGRGSNYDVTGGTGSQMYQGFQYRKGKRRLAGESAAGRQVVEQTSGLICTYRGRLFCTYYSAICGGRTTHGTAIFSDAAAPLQSVPCTWCRGSKYYRWEAELSRSKLESKLGSYFRDHGQRFTSLDDLAVLAPPGLGEVPSVRIGSAGRSLELPAYTFRLAVGAGPVRSGFFQTRNAGSAFQFWGRGWGHGVGLCQWGARGQALAGRTTTQILQYYYRGCQLTAVQ